MTDLRTRIREALGDDDDRLSVDEAVAMRRVVLAAVRGEEARTRWSLQPLAVAATVMLMIGVGVLAAGRFERRDHAAPPNSATDHPAERRPDRARQLHFSTPGGTRIIWIFNSDLDLKTAP